MFELFLALFMAFSCPAQNTNNSDGTVTAKGHPADGDDGSIPPRPPKP